ncbi:hypothetical protein LUZ60_008052 [Juncus effusus]|nr:hypothetical protein LUZ60_008052 [Juncus effusus]
MRRSCNGCRVLRKACGEDCLIKPCLSWIESPGSQAHATQFLSKFYGRAVLMSLIRNGPPNLRPAIYRSLLYEACGRIINPVFGSVGLQWSGRWHLCQAAVEAVLKGLPISQISSDDLALSSSSPHKSPGDIWHVNNAPEAKLHKANKRKGRKSKNIVLESAILETKLVKDVEKDKLYGEIIEMIESPLIEDGQEQEQEEKKKMEGEVDHLNLGFDLVTRVYNPNMYEIDLNL